MLKRPVIGRTAAVACLLLATGLWGASNVAQKSMFSDLGPFSALALRYVLAGISMMPFVAMELRRANPEHAALRPVDAPAILLFGFAAILQQFAATMTSATNLSLLINLTIIFVPLIVWALRSIRPGLRVLGCVAVTFVGSVLLSGGGVGTFQAGDALCILSAFVYALWIVAVEKNIRYSALPITMTSLQFVYPAALGTLCGLMFENVTAEAAVSALPDLIVAAVLGSGLGTVLAVTAQSRLDATTSAVCYSFEAVAGAVLGWLFLGEVLSAVAATGAALILIGVVLSQLPGGRRRETTAMNSGRPATPARFGPDPASGLP
jgi:drug/metabolite transporter (DMT)-like permease